MVFPLLYPTEQLFLYFCKLSESKNSIFVCALFKTSYIR